MAGQVAVLLSPHSVLLAVVVALILGASVGWVWNKERSAKLQMLVVTAALGGAAMLVGSLIDMRGADTEHVERASAREAEESAASASLEELPPCHAAAREAASTRELPGPARARPLHELVVDELCSWMTVLMLLACVPGCALLCRPCRGHASRRARILAHVLCTATMLIGMMLGGVWFGPVLAGVGLGLLSASHLSMLLGMVLGTLVGIETIDLFSRQAPPSPKTPQATS